MALEVALLCCNDSPKDCNTALSRSVCSWRRLRCSTERESGPMDCSSLRRSVTACERFGAISRMKRKPNAAARAIMTRTRSTCASDLDVDDLPDPEEADDLEDDRHDHHQLADRIGEQQLDVRGVQRVDRAADGERQHREDVAAEPALRGVDPELAA